MIQKWWVVLVLAILACARTQAQQTDPQQQTPEPQAPATETSPSQPQSSTAPAQSSSQEATEEEIGPRRKKAPAFDKWTFNVGVGDNLPRGTTKKFVKGGGLLGDFAIARNYSQYFGFRLDAQFVDLPLRVSALEAAGAPNASNYVFALTLDPQISVPVTKRYTGYVLIGPSYYHRFGDLNTSTAVPGGACNPFYIWWGACKVASIPISGHFLSESLNEFGFNFGGGVTRKTQLWKSDKTDLFAEYRQQHGSRHGITTDWRSVTVGVHW